MKSELIVDVHPDRTLIALTEDDRLMEVNEESRTEATFSVGNIYYGRVKKVMPALNAVFVDVGHEKEAFLHYLDLGSEFLTLEKFTNEAVQQRGRRPQMLKIQKQKEVGKQGNVQDILKVGQEILVQVTKEPINTKGPRLTAEISLAGRNIVLIPFGDKVMVSNKIKSEKERHRLKQQMQQIRPERFGIIVRTVAEGKRLAELDAELRQLLKRWDDAVARLQKAKSISLIAEESNRTIGIIRDIFTPSFTSIQVNDPVMYEEIKDYVSTIAPESEKVVHLYQEDQPIMDHFQITRQMKTGLGRTVGFKNGGYLIMERTEALFSIDVNSGSRKQGLDQEENAFNCNMLAADEIYHQLRLRDIGGIIIVDFIDMDSAEHRQLLFEHMRQLMKRDRARHNVLQLSKFGLMQITRQRVRPVVEVDVEEECPTCAGKGKIQPSILFTEQLDEQIELFTNHFGKGLKLYVHPFIYAYACKGLFWRTLRFRWRMQFGIRLLEDESLPLLGYRFVGADGVEVVMPRVTEYSTQEKADKKAALYTQKPIEEKPEVRLAGEDDTDKTATEATSGKKKKRRRKKKGEANAEPGNGTSVATPEVETVSEAPIEVVTEEPAAEEKEVAPQPATKSKRKSRSRASKKAEASQDVATQAQEPATESVAPEASAPAADSSMPADEKAKDAKPKRKCSPKKATPSEEKPMTAEPVAEPAKEVTADAPVAEEKKPKKRTTRKKSTKATASKEAEASDVNPAEKTETQEKPKRKRASRKKDPNKQEA